MPQLRRVERGVAGVEASFAQQRLWFLDRLAPGGREYVMPVTLRILGALDVDVLCTALDALVARHEALRTSFHEVEGRPWQKVAPTGSIPLVVHDFTDVPRAELEERVREAVEAQVAVPFDLGQAPLARAWLARIGPEDHQLTLITHHIVSDGWSLGVLARDLDAFYTASLLNSAPSLPELPLQYADFAVSQREWLQGPVLEEQLAYWERTLTGIEPLRLPTDAPRPASRSGRGARHEFSIPAELANQLRALSSGNGATLFMTLLAAFQVLLARYSGQDDIAVGTPIAGRRHSELDQLIGMFVNTLVLRVDLSEDPTFTQLLATTRRQALDAYAHQDIPFERLVEHLQPERDLSTTPLFQAMFVLQNATDQPWTLHDLTVQR
ncbi:condensation domain-containing protein, partial [Streptomyces sp. GbtcB6]|uniref:condensation domain-containing protein n=1 Tax=Streptomyces sp. GbtcB6 TaxID=2824751 RepID=UPI0020C61847